MPFKVAPVANFTYLRGVPATSFMPHLPQVAHVGGVIYGHLTTFPQALARDFSQILNSPKCSRGFNRTVLNSLAVATVAPIQTPETNLRVFEESLGSGRQITYECWANAQSPLEYYFRAKKIGQACLEPSPQFIVNLLSSEYLDISELLPQLFEIPVLAVLLRIEPQEQQTTSREICGVIYQAFKSFGEGYPNTVLKTLSELRKLNSGRPLKLIETIIYALEKIKPVVTEEVTPPEISAAELKGLLIQMQQGDASVIPKIINALRTVPESQTANIILAEIKNSLKRGDLKFIEALWGQIETTEDFPDELASIIRLMMEKPGTASQILKVRQVPPETPPKRDSQTGVQPLPPPKPATPTPPKSPTGQAKGPVIEVTSFPTGQTAPAAPPPPTETPKIPPSPPPEKEVPPPAAPSKPKPPATQPVSPFAGKAATPLSFRLSTEPPVPAKPEPSWKKIHLDTISPEAQEAARIIYRHVCNKTERAVGILISGRSVEQKVSYLWNAEGTGARASLPKLPKINTKELVHQTLKYLIDVIVEQSTSKAEPLFWEAIQTDLENLL